MLGFDKIPLYGVLILTFGGGLLCGLGVKFFVVPWLQRRILKEFSQSNEPIIQYAANGEMKEKKPDHQSCQKNTDKAETVVCLNESGSYSYLTPKFRHSYQ